METRARYVLIGLFALAVIVAGFSFVYWLENKGGLGQRDVYRVRFEQPVAGLQVGSSVVFNGIRVGEVADLRLDPGDPRRVTATIGVAAGTPVRTDTKVDVDFQGLTGTATIALKGGSQAAAAPQGENGAPPVLMAEPNAGQDWTRAARDVLGRLDGILEQNAEPLHSAIGNINTFSDALARNSEKVDGILSGLERLTGGGGGAKGPVPVYDLEAPKDFPAAPKPPEGQLVIPEPTTVLAFNTDRILAQPSQGESVPIEDAKWSDNLPNLFQEKLIQSFENAGYLRFVSRRADGLDANYQLLLDVRLFQLSLSPAPEARLDFVAKILGQDGAILAARRFRAQEPADGTDAAAAAAALNAAFAEAAKALVAWTVAAVPATPPVVKAPPQ